MIDPSKLILWKAGDPHGTFTRATAGTYQDSDGVLQSAASGAQRNAHYAHGVRMARFEAARTNVALNPDTPNSWTNYGASPTIGTGETDPWGGAAAIVITDDDATGSEGKYTGCTFTGDGTKCAVVAIRAGSAATILAAVVDTSALAVRHQVLVTWNGGTTAPTLETAAGAGTLFDPIPVYDPAGNLWWLVRFSAAGIVAANTNTLRVHGTTSGTGTFYLAGGNAWDALYPTSWQGASLGTRNADRLTQTLPETFDVRSGVTVYAYLERPAHADVSGTLGIFPTICRLYGIDNEHLWLTFLSTTREIELVLTDVNGSGEATPAAVASIPSTDVIEVCAQMRASDGAARLDIGNGFGSWGTGLATPMVRPLTTLTIGNYAGNQYLDGALYVVVVAEGLYTLDDMRLAAAQPYIAFEDDTGEARLYANVPTLGGARPDVQKIGDVQHRLSDATRYRYTFRRDYTIDVTLAPLFPNQLTTALRLQEHLDDGGTVTLMTADKDYAVYTCRLAPGTTPEIQFADQQALDFAFHVTLKNTSDAAMTARYR